MEFRLLEGLRKNGRPTAEPAAVFDALAEVRAYWEGLRRDGGIPSRTDLDPRGISGALDSVFVAERIGTGLVRIRIAGSALSEIAGMDLRGLPMSCLFQAEARSQLSMLVERVFTGPIVAELHLEAEQGLGRPGLDSRLLLLPLLDGDRSHTLVLGCLSRQGALGRAPRRFAIHRATEQRLDIAAIAQAQKKNFDHPPVRNPAAQGRHDYLRLVYSAE